MRKISNKQHNLLLKKIRKKKKKGKVKKETIKIREKIKPDETTFKISKQPRAVFLKES